MKHLVLVGACYLDTILTVPRFPAEDSKLRATAVQVRRGGNCANSLEVLAQLLAAGPHRLPPVKLHLVSCLPDAEAPATSRILSSFGHGAGAAAIDFGYCLYREGHQEPASSYIIRSTETGSRTIVNYNDLPEMTASEFERIVDAFAEHRDGDGGDNGDGVGWWWHFEGRIPETTLRCIRYLRQALPRCTISVEVEKPGREGLVELAAEADVVFYSRSWAENRGYTSPEACLRAEAPSSRATVGAGDTFIAGMLYGLHADGWSPEATLAFAVELATKKVQREGFAGLTV
ncbi:a1d22f46-8c71-4f8d-a079-2b3ff2a424d3 [Thermothielavioides terrestris]|uniref:A1d22f46-8c71-4f8d-a079-2b3ff2a424d3 n=1 Tax=Thermothielavioides terrestris TaxID=2587410 RepID=A0A446BH76_9PEZI|nr:a1d22f46-8c71-4f8d-a079-2b3ff2a424d3 [Thermothielavioides terrestris]